MISDTHCAEYLTHCEAILAVLRTAEVRLFPPDDPGPLDHTGVTILPALTAMQITRGGRARFRRTLARGDYDPDSRFWCDARGQAWLVLPLVEVLPMLHFSKHPVGISYAVWQCEVDVALTAHGWYDPATRHQVPTGSELDALELQSAMREQYRSHWGRSWEETWGRSLNAEEV